MPQSGAVFGARYFLGPLLGRGGMADVYQAEDLVGGGAVAVKILRGQQPGELRRFAVEADILRRLDHPAVARLLDSGDHDGVPYLVLELIDGQPLSRLLDSGPLPAERVAEIGAALADGLAHAHSLGVTHRDVKPGNVLIDGAGRPHLTDFGIARLVGGEALTTTGQVLGTACYLAPEQVQGHEVGPAADVYSLGLVLIEALTGRRPFDGSGSEAALLRLTRDPAVPLDAPPWFGQALTAMTAREPGRRPDAATVGVVFAERSSAPLGAVTARVPEYPPTAVLPAAAAGAAAAASAPRRPLGRWLAAAVAALGVVALVVAGLLAGGDGTPDPADTVTTTTPTTVVTTTAPPSTTTTEKDDDKKDNDRSDNDGRGGGGGDDD